MRGMDGVGFLKLGLELPPVYRRAIASARTPTEIA
jgi:hypothetical protein